MTEQQAIQKAQSNQQRWGRDYIVVDRPSHPHTPGLYVVAKNEKYLWTDDEILVFDTSRSMEERLDVRCDEDGLIVIHVDRFTAARLAGRRIFGKIPETQKELESAIADAWYEADCP